MFEVLATAAERYGDLTLIAGILVAEAVLDFIKDMIIDWVKDRREDKGLSEWGNEPDDSES